ncbi:hypothetical protein [Paractinoplanes rishiriensis]|nr:hypothetical protein [Actinoplanes rishiriensis]
MVDAQNRAFGGDRTPSGADVDRLGRLQSGGGVAGWPAASTSG